MKIALVHEFLTQLGGAERVLEAMHEVFPTAPVYTLVYDRQKTKNLFASWDIRTSFLQRLPGGVAHYKLFLPLMPRAIESFDLQEYDLILSDSSAFAKGVRGKPGSVHVCYCHTPTRYLWVNMDEYVATLPYPGIIKYAAKLYLKKILKARDYRAAQYPSYFIANSLTVQNRIREHYHRDSAVIFPPVDTIFFKPLNADREYFLTGSRLEPYKRIDLVVKVFNRLNLPLKVVGSGADSENLRSSAKANIEFIGRVSDQELRRLYAGAKAFIFPALEDAGIMVLESLACGTPVLGLNSGGTAEFVREGREGVLFDNQTEDDISEAVEKFNRMKFDEKQIRARAMDFDKQKFKQRVLNFIAEHQNI